MGWLDETAEREDVAREGVQDLTVLEKLRSELVGAVAVSAGVLVAAGYAITWAKLENEDLPTEAVLAALPRTYYLGAAAQALLVPLFILLTLGIVWLAYALKRAPGHNLPGTLIFGATLAVYSWFVAALTNPFAFGASTTKYVVAVLICGAATIAITFGLGKLAELRLRALAPENGDPSGGDRLKLAGALVLVAAVITASAFRVVDAYFVDRALPEAVVFTDRDDCPPDKQRIKPGCSEKGAYIGESDQWLYLVEPKPTAVVGAKTGQKLPGGLIVVPRDNIRHIRLSETLK